LLNQHFGLILAAGSIWIFCRVWFSIIELGMVCSAGFSSAACFGGLFV
jgi:hypothetical protein